MSGTEDTLLLGNQLCFSVYAAAHAFNRVYKRLLAGLGLTYPQYLAMLVLWERDGLAVKDIGARLQLDSGTLTPLLKRLERAGLIVRRRDGDDERQVRVLLTQKGRALREEAAGVPAGIARALGTSVPDLAKLRDELAGMREALDAFAR